ncbi:hypothetical protein EJB05_16525 [Eragrostis curvula]|uniref:Uncharacterized protein n=1 Tax=Eragrostis curvula TaxID=38414 RepID=A0A5J9VI66_9POAL|nr:hypothetical protein EJB05_16525 [Eragrostis curvula]
MDQEDQAGGHLEGVLLDGVRRPVDLVGDLALEAFWDLASTLSAAAACCRIAVRRSSSAPLVPVDLRRPSEF